MMGLFIGSKNKTLWVDELKRLSVGLMCVGVGLVMGCDEREHQEVAEAAAVVAVVSTAVVVGALVTAHDDDHDHEPAAKKKPYHHHHKSEPDHVKSHRIPDDHRYGDHRYNNRGKLKKKYRNIHCVRDRVCYKTYSYRGQRHKSCQRERICRNPQTRHFHRHGGIGFHSHKGDQRTRHMHPRYFMTPYVDYKIVRQELSHSMVTDLVSVGDFARAHYLSLESSRRLLYSLELARGGDLSGLYDLGFSDEDLRDLARLRLPSGESVDRIAGNLDHMPVLTQGMLARMIKEGRRILQEEAE